MSEVEATGLERAEVIVIDNEGVSEAETELVPAEQDLLLVINDSIEARFACSPHRIRSLIAGWLTGEGVIETPDEFVALETDWREMRVDIRVTDECFARVSSRIERGPIATLGDAPITREADTSLEVKPIQVGELGEQFRRLYLSLRSPERMCYLTGIASIGEILTYGEGYHRLNSLYRALGEMVLHRQSSERKIVLSNYGMTRSHVMKLARAGISMAISLTAPTSSAIKLANDYYITLASAGLGEATRVYSAAWRLV